jgi:hypothetical protein
MNKSLKEEMAEQYAESEASAWTNDYNGFVAGWEAAMKQREIPLSPQHGKEGKRKLKWKNKKHKK